MKQFLTIPLIAVGVVSCMPSSEHVNAWDRTNPALDRVGVSALREEARAKAERAKFKPGESVTFKSGKVAVCSTDPEKNSFASTKMRDASQAKVLVCSDYYAKVQFSDGKTGFVNISEIVDPNELLVSDLPEGLAMDEEMPTFLQEGDTPATNADKTLLPPTNVPASHVPNEELPPGL